jgi:menaquinone-dependent protoporphyrinogen oxidase
MAVLIVFESIEGQTAKIVQHIEAMLSKSGQQVRLVDTSDKRVHVSYQDVNKVVLAAPVHERRHPASFEVFVAGGKKSLAECETLMLSVSLKAAFADGLEEAEDYLTEMEMRTGFTATRKLLVAGAVRRGSYDYFSSQILRYVVLAGQDTELGETDHEFTDWAALDVAVNDFVAA